MQKRFVILQALLIQKEFFLFEKKVNNVSREYLINLMSNLLDIESLLKQGNNPINVFTEKLINLS